MEKKGYTYYECYDLMDNNKDNKITKVELNNFFKEKIRIPLSANDLNLVFTDFK